MKKSLLTVVTFALCLINVVLSALMAIVIVPEVKKVNSLVSQVSTAIELDLEAGKSQSGASNIPIEQLAYYSISAITVSLKDDGDGKNHIANINMVMSIDTKHENYGTYGAPFDNASDKKGTYDDLVKSIVNEVVSQYTVSEIKDSPDTAQDAIRLKLNEKFGDNFVVSINFSQVLTQ